MAQAEVPPESVDGLPARLEAFVPPFAATLPRVWRGRVPESLTGLLSALEHKTAEGIASLFDRDRQPFQRSLGQSEWDHGPLRELLAMQVGDRLGEVDAVVVFDPSAFAKEGTKSVGVGRQWCGRLGKVENCQVGVYMGDVSRRGHAIVNVRPYLPEEWAKDRARRDEAGVPKGVKFQTRHALALEMLDECGDRLPHGWVAGDDEMGRPGEFRRDLHALTARLDELIATEWQDEDAERLIKRSRRHRDDPFTFLDEPDVPFDNNHAERAIRPAVMIRKDSFGNRSDRGADTQAVLMSVDRTLQQRGHAPLETIVDALSTYLATGKLPPLPAKLTPLG